MSRDKYVDTTKPVIIGGAGPAGLMLGLLLTRHNLPFYILEKRKQPHTHSKAIGIHPPSLNILEELELLDPFRSAGYVIHHGEAYLGSQKAGTLPFSRTPFDHPYILTLPQHETERLLREKLLNLRPGCIKYGHEVTGWKAGESGVLHIKYRTPNQSTTAEPAIRTIQAALLAGCDGRYSNIRGGMDLDINLKTYPDTYIMADFQMEGKENGPAAVYLHPEGVIESFPLPGNQRRWVVRTPTYESQPSPTRIIDAIRERIDHDPGVQECLRTSGFKVEQYISERLYKHRCVLAGDAAHVVSPIGGQGMNLGWLGAKTLAEQIALIYGGTDYPSALKIYEQVQRKRVCKAMHRARFNMWMGRAHDFSWTRRLLIKLMVRTPLRHLAARAFTMYGLRG